MTLEQWNAFKTFKNEFFDACKKWSHLDFQLKLLQEKIAKSGSLPYPIETPIVYNTALDAITEKDEIGIIFVGDNPGKNEQLKKNQKYLIGKAGKTAQNFFAKNPELKIDFKKNALILNKTPIHTAKTAELKLLAKSNEEISRLIIESQTWMAKKTAQLHNALAKQTEIWLVGYSELKKNGIFNPYKDAFFLAYKNFPKMWERVRVFRHFSMGAFSGELKKKSEQNQNLNIFELLKEIGVNHRKEIFNA